jgi:hypothetical protein
LMRIEKKSPSGFFGGVQVYLKNCFPYLKHLQLWAGNRTN